MSPTANGVIVGAFRGGRPVTASQSEVAVPFSQFPETVIVQIRAATALTDELGDCAITTVVTASASNV